MRFTHKLVSQEGLPDVHVYPATRDAVPGGPSCATCGSLTPRDGWWVMTVATKIFYCCLQHMFDKERVK